ncbi:heterokaryon incompatibility protein 6, or allele [Fusarium flagelliforme]|uniref:Heterokaryon incompatibility protein 6, or allele n=1 Tax=Fusarium flagelliforme TaxID=2675880 RepID=A0A395M9V7_9HYPO|nr:heterokaryon incompatibility protein 6, or allele [Fusarium flagelliforme]
MSNTTFKHQALDNPAESIRLVHVKAQQNAPFLELCLSTHSVANIVPYFAVSYTWGDGLLTEDISINEHPTKVTKNCLYALKQINKRHPSHECSEEPTYLWIDSICINQADNDEKGHQVAMMGSIYAKATKVLACIGPAADNSTILRNVLDDIQIHHTQFYAYREHLRSGGWGLPDNDRKIAQFLRSYLRGSKTPKDKFEFNFARHASTLRTGATGLESGSFRSLPHQTEVATASRSYVVVIASQSLKLIYASTLPPFSTKRVMWTMLMSTA